MVIGERVNAKIGDFAAVSMELKQKSDLFCNGNLWIAYL